MLQMGMWMFSFHVKDTFRHLKECLEAFKVSLLIMKAI